MSDDDDRPPPKLDLSSLAPKGSPLAPLGGARRERAGPADQQVPRGSGGPERVGAEVSVNWGDHMEALAVLLPDGFTRLKVKRDYRSAVIAFWASHTCGTDVGIEIRETVLVDAMKPGMVVAEAIANLRCQPCWQRAQDILADHEHPPCGYADNDADVQALIEAGNVP